MRAACSVLAHRGPDGEGTHFDGPLAFGHRRLSIIDVAGSPQPMRDPDADLWITFNGEIFNYQGLRRELLAKGHNFKTQGDTEVLLHLYRACGPAMLDRLNGMFAFAIWDGARRELLLARDPMGVKPLYYAATPEMLVFASEVKALLVVPGVERALDSAAVPQYFRFTAVHGEGTLFRGIRRLLPGHCLRASAGCVETARYWDLDPPSDALTGGQGVEDLRRLIESAVSLQMISDVPVGSLCSGGLDSTMVSALCVRNSTTRFNTYNATFPFGPPTDESPYARIAARAIGSKHHEVLVTPDAMAEKIENLIWHFDEPLHDTSSIAIFFVALRAREDVKVLLAGEGADELFGGYPRYELLRQWFVFSHPLLGPIARGIGGRLLPERRRRKLAEHAGLGWPEIAALNVSTLSSRMIRELLDPELLRTHERPVSPLAEELLGAKPQSAHEALERLFRFEQRTFLVSSLERLDKMTMAASIEGRVPLLDQRLVWFANRLPLWQKRRPWEGKHILRRACRGFVPPSIVWRRKHGFGLPLERFLEVASLRDRVDLLREPAAEQRPWLRSGALRRLVDRGLEAEPEYAESIWRLLNLELWYRGVMEGRFDATTGRPIAAA